MESINKVELRGVVGSSRYQQFADKGCVKFSLCTIESYNDGLGNTLIHNTWHSVTYWLGAGEQDKAAIGKGDTVHVWGSLRQQRYMDSDGVERSIPEIIAHRVELFK